MVAEFFRQSETLVEVELIYVTVSGDPHEPTPIPAALAKRIAAYERLAPAS